jgi:hypothetical protein
MTEIRMNITADDLAPLQRAVREGSAMLTEALREAERLRNQTILCAGPRCSFAAPCRWPQSAGPAKGKT